MVLVRTGEDEGRDTKDIFRRDLGWIRCRPFELEGIDTGGDWADKTIIQLLIQLLVSGGCNVNESPFEIWSTVVLV